MSNNGSGSDGKGTLIQVVLDKSGSMGTVQQATVSGFNEFLQEHRTKVPAADFCLTLFDTQYEQRYVAAPAKDIPDLTIQSYQPGGNTALLDAIGMTIRSVEQYGDKYERVVFVILTDGLENSSKQYTREQIRDLIEWHQNEGKGWEFMFIGANIDSYSEAGMIGVRAANTSNYNATPTGTHAAFETLSSVTSGYSSGQRSSTSLSKKERAKIEKTK